MKKLEKLALERGKSLGRIIPPLVNLYGVVGAATKLNVSPSTISKWLADNGYVSRTYWMQEVKPSELADIEAAHDRVNASRIENGLPSIEEELEAS